MMEVINGLLTVLLIVIFLGIWVWAWSKKNKTAFDEMANLPLEDTAVEKKVNSEADHVEQ